MAGITTKDASLLGPAACRMNFYFPVAEYNIREAVVSITGGYVYRGAMQNGRAFIYTAISAQYHLGTHPFTRSTIPDAWLSQALFETHASITTFGQDPSGEKYFADRGGTIYLLGK